MTVGAMRGMDAGCRLAGTLVPPALTQAERFRALKRAETDLPWAWFLVGAIAMLVVALILRRRARRKDIQIDRRILTARVEERGFTEEETDLIHRIADVKGGARVSEIVPRLRHYDDALERFISEETGDLGEEARAALAETLGKLRGKLGFQKLAEYRHIPSTREVPVGTAMMSRPAGRQDVRQVAAIAHYVDDLRFEIQFVPEERRGLDEPPDPPKHAPGSRFEFFFAHGQHRRCRFTSRTIGPSTGRGWVYPMEHVRVESIALSRSTRTEIAIEATLRTAGGKTLPVILLELTGNGALLAAPLPAAVVRGTLAFTLPGSESSVQVEVERHVTDAETVTPLDRSRLRFRDVTEETRQRIFRYIRQSADPVATA